MRLADSIAEFRAKETIEPIYILRNDQNAAVLLAWKYHTQPFDPAIEVDAGSWSALWKGIEIDYKSLSRMSDVSEGQCVLIVERLNNFRLIYPDGTITDPAEKYLRAVTQSHLSEIGKR